MLNVRISSYFKILSKKENCIKLSKLIVSIILCALMLCPASAYATAEEYFVYISIESSRSYSSSFALDFSASTAWTLNFNNNAFAFLNHRYVTVEYLSCNPSGTDAKIQIQLYIDNDGDGIYEEYDQEGSYTFQLKVGESTKISLPYENTVKNYRLLLINQTLSAISG